jgi:hypothetical protein
MVLVVSLLFGAVAFAGTTADAQHRHRRGTVIVRPRVFVTRPFFPRAYWYSPYYYSYTPTHVTAGQGYKDGYDDGKDDAKDNKGYNPQRHRDFQDSMTSAYTDSYLRGYADGYRERAGD